MTRPELRGITVGEFISALEREGFYLDRTRGNHLRYRNADGRQVTVAFHRSGATFGKAMLHSLLRATRWNDEDLRRIGLLD